MQASSARARPGRSSAWPASPRRTGPRRLPSRWPSSPARSRLRIRSGHPAGERAVPAVVRRFEEHRVPELVVAAAAGDLGVSRAAAAPGGLPGRLAQARRPAELRLAGPQLVTERAGFRLVLEQRSGHLNDHVPASCRASMIIVTCTDDRYQDQPVVSRPRLSAGGSWLRVRPPPPAVTPWPGRPAVPGSMMRAARQRFSPAPSGGRRAGTSERAGVPAADRRPAH